MGRYKKAKIEEIKGVEIAPDQMQVQNDEGDVIVIAASNFPDHERLGWIAVPVPEPEAVHEPEAVSVPVEDSQV